MPSHPGKKKAGRKKPAKKAPRKKAANKKDSARKAQAFTARQLRFIDEYQVDANATQAAVRAGYSEKTAKSQGARLLTNVDIVAAIAKAEQVRSERCQYTADQALLDLIPLTDVNVANFITPEGKLAGIAEIGKLPWDITAQIVSLKTVEKFDQFGNPIIETEFKLHDRVKAITQAGRHRAVQAWAERVEVSHSLADRMAAIRSGEAG